MDRLAHGFHNSGSQTSENGSTPKRPRPRPVSKDSSRRTPVHRNPPAISKSLSKQEHLQRSALLPISPNRRHTTAGFAQPASNDNTDGRQSLPLRKRRGSMQGSGEAETAISLMDVEIVGEMNGTQEDGLTTEL